MVLPFDKKPSIHKRYDFYTPMCNIGENNPEEYVNFLRNINNGTLPTDSTVDHQEKIRSVKSKVDTGLGDKSAVKINQSVPPLPKGSGVHAVNQIAKQNKKELVQKMNIIQDNMLKNKQEERKLKRIEGDIVKKQRLLRRVMKDYEHDVFGQKKVEDMKLRGSIQQIEEAKHEHLVTELEKSKEKHKEQLSDVLENKQNARKDLLMKNDLQYQYTKTAKELEVKRTEVTNLTKEYEQKIRLKELEEFNLTKKLAELAIATTMEDHKHKTMESNFELMLQDTKISKSQEALARQRLLETQLNLGKSHERSFENNQRLLNQNLNDVNDNMLLKIREEGRKMTDISRSIQENASAQKNTQIFAEYLSREEQGKAITLKQHMAEAKRTSRLEDLSKQRKLRNAERMSRAGERFIEIGNDNRKVLYNDSIRHLQKSVSKQEEMEHLLYNQVRSSEGSYRKQEQQCRRLQDEYKELQRENARQLKELEIECKAKERAFQQHLLRENAGLQKSRVNREEGIQHLVKLRQLLREEKHRLNEDEKEHHRLTNFNHSITGIS